MICNGCGNAEAYQIRSIYDKGEVFDSCDRCGNVSVAALPDAYLGHIGQTFSSLCDDMGRPIPIQSKRHKAEVMKSLGVSEAGDRVNGAPYGSKSWTEGTREMRRKSYDKDRPKIREIYQRYLNRASR